MYNLPYVEFYITNVCNLNCKNCNRFNNFSFSGHQRWEDYAATYAQWSKILSVPKIGIIGGEPLLNPTFLDWLQGISILWPDSLIVIYTNGTQLLKRPELYDQLIKFKDQLRIDISFHNENFKPEVLDFLNEWLKGPIVRSYKKTDYADHNWQISWNAIADSSWPDCSTPEDFVKLPASIQDECRTVHQLSLEHWQKEFYSVDLLDSNGLHVNVNPAYQFHESSIIHDIKSNSLKLHNSDPEKAIEVCYSKRCPHFIEGKLYKCGPVGLLPEFVKQFDVQLSAEQKNLLQSYKPAILDWKDDQLLTFINELKEEKAIPQCTFCTERVETEKISAGTKKIKIVKRK